MGSYRIPETILIWNSMGIKRKGRLREQWMDGVRRNLISKDFREEVAEDRKLWWSIISLGYLLVLHKNWQ